MNHRVVFKQTKPPCTNKDMGALKGMSDHCPQAAQILVTGEVNADLIGDDAGMEYMVVNAFVQDPLFVHTEYNTWMMTRACTIKSAIPDDLALKLVKNEADRHGFKQFTHIYQPFKFFEEHFAMNGYFHKYAFIPNQHDFFLLNGMLLFLKPTFADTSFCGYLANHDIIKKASFRTVEKALLLHRNEVWLQNSRYLTNDELSILASLYEHCMLPSNVRQFIK